MSNAPLPPGEYRLNLAATQADPTLAGNLGEILAMFANAIERGMFAPGRLVGPARPASTEQAASLVMSAESLDAAAFAVLGGMVEFFRGQGLPLGSLDITGPDGRFVSPKGAAPAPPPPALPFDTTLPVLEFNRPFVVLVDFQGGIPPEHRPEILSTFMVWTAMLCGGYPPEGAPAGSSGVAAGGARFLDPALVEYSNEAWFANQAGLTPLLLAFQQIHASFPVVGVEVQ